MNLFSRVVEFGVGLCLLASLPAAASTLQQLSVNDLAQKSTAIVRGRVQAQTQTVRQGALLYSHFTVKVTDVWKGTVPTSTIDLAVPGGTLGAVREIYAGTPNLTVGQEYLFCLWTSPRGITQIIGLSQGVFDLAPNGTGDFLATRSATTERMLDSAGRPVIDSNFSMVLSDLRQMVQNALRGAK